MKFRESTPWVEGNVLTCSDPGYARAIKIDNGRVVSRPALVVQPHSIDDVRRALAFAREQRMQTTIKGGGHSAAGYCLNSGGLVIDMSAMCAVEVDARNALIRVGAGARWRDVYAALLATGTGLIPIGGGCADVGVAGFVLGGGYSFVSRSYGLGCDSLLALTIVTAEGRVLRISGSSSDGAERDLFWACRGGGGGNFGVVVDMELRAHLPPTPEMLMVELRYECVRAREVMTVYNAWVETLPPELAAYGIWRAAPDQVNGNVAQVFGFTVVYNGEAERGRVLLEPMIALAPCQTRFQQTSLPTYELSHGTETALAGAHAYVRAGVMPPHAWTDETIDVLSSTMAAAPTRACFVVWTHAGGNIATVADDATAFPHRTARYIPQVKAVWSEPAEAAVAIEWAYRMFQELEPHFVGAYVNYIDPLLSGWADNYYGRNYARLLQIKQAWDPEGFFRFPQAIGSNHDHDAGSPLDLPSLLH